uniref:Nucleolar protein 9 n=1 Tax=Corethron hystrix TaxID=216773 RepID=A0A7S1FN17_9STRA
MHRDLVHALVLGRGGAEDEGEGKDEGAGEKKRRRAVLADYVSHPIANHVLQRLLATVRHREEADALIRPLCDLMGRGAPTDADVSQPGPLHPSRRGVLHHTAELAAKYRVGQERFLKYLTKGLGESLAECVVTLLHVELVAPSPRGRSVVLDVHGARTVRALLDFVPRLTQDILEGVVGGSLDGETLAAVARDALGSRCVMDGVLDGPVASSPFSAAVVSLFEILRPHLLTLATDRVGHHTVKKIFAALPPERRAELTAELAGASGRLGGNAMGRAVIEACFVEEFLAGESAFMAAVARMKNREGFLEDIMAKSGEGGRKRKRKRRRAKQGNE